MQVQEIKKMHLFRIKVLELVEVIVLNYYDNYLPRDTTGSPIILRADDHAVSMLLSERISYYRCCK
jgi:hypothetical protein